MALIIVGEFGVYKEKAPITYWEAIEALSNQYSSIKTTSNIQCGGECTLATQISWLTDMEAWYAGKYTLKPNYLYLEENWLPHYSAAQQASLSFYIGSNTSWFWGNVNDLSTYLVTSLVETQMYFGTNYFIVFSQRIK